MSRANALTAQLKVPNGGSHRIARLLAATAIVALVLTPLASGSAVAQNSVSLLRDAEIEKILRDDATPIFVAAGLNPKDVTIYIAGDKELNAGVSGGQNVILNSGLITRTKNPNELLGVLAHETGHIASAHLVRRDEAMPGALATRMITYGFGLLAALTASDPRAAASLLYSADYFAALQLASYTRIQEGAADQAAAKFLEQAGESGKGLVSFFENFRAQEVYSEAARYAYFRSHPLSSDRIANLRQRVEDSPHYTTVDSPEEMEKHRIMIAKLRGYLNYPQQTFQDYPETDQTFPARYARAIAHYRETSVERAIKEVDLLIADFPDNPYLHEMKGQILFETGKVAESEAPYRRAVELAPDQPLLLTPFSQTLLAIKREGAVEEAILNLERALRQDRENPMGWRLLAEAYEVKGEAGMARLAVAEQSFSLGQLVNARQFGLRARELLAEGTPQHRRAVDIINAAESTMFRRRGS